LNENNSLSDKEVILKVAGYDSKALEELYNRYSPILYTLIKRIIQDAELAEEVLSDIFVIIWRKIDQFEFKTNNVYTWLITLARNKAVDTIVRKRSPELLPEYTDEYENERILPKLSTEIEPLELVKVMSINHAIKDTVSKLTDAQRYVIELAYYEGFNETEIAKKLNIPLPTLKSKIQLAMDRVMQNVSKMENGDG
jgi:RNA polymerase sigma-70 factor (ECF subfamily)